MTKQKTPAQYIKVPKQQRLRYAIIGFGILLFAFFAFVIPRLPIITGYVAKEVCSCTFIAERDVAITKKEDVGYFPISLASFSIDYENKSVRSHIAFLGGSTAVFRKSLGCTLIHETEIEEIKAQNFSRPMTLVDENLPFPYGDEVIDTLPSAINASTLDSAMAYVMESKGTRAALVLYKGQLVAENYANGFNKDSKHLAWSISKSVTNALYGVMAKKGIIDIQKPTDLATWEDERAMITVNNLLQMNSGLEWTEDYFELCEVTKMLFKNEDMGEYAASAEFEFKPQKEWKYSSGTSNILAEIMENRIGNQTAYWAFPYMELFNQIGIQSILLEADASGTFVGSSYAWATARDWARFGQLYLNDGVWNEGRIFPKGWVEYSTTPAAGSEGIYGAQIWLNSSGEYLEHCPKDLYNFGGFNGQNITMIPSENLVIVRFGLNSIEKLDYAAFVNKVVLSLK